MSIISDILDYLKDLGSAIAECLISLVGGALTMLAVATILISPLLIYAVAWAIPILIVVCTLKGLGVL